MLRLQKKNNLFFYLLPLFISCASVSAKSTKTISLSFDVELKTSKVVDGGLVFLKITPKRADIKDPKFTVVFEKKPFEVFTLDKGKSFMALVVVPYDSLPRKTEVEVELKAESVNEKLDVPIQVLSGKYPKAVAALKVDKGFVELTPQDIERDKKEKAESAEIYARVTPKVYWTGAFKKPVESEITSPFGKKRTYNDPKMAPKIHWGTDLRAPTGTPIKAPAPGLVVLAKDLFFSGGTVIIDHGYGLFTTYMHMSKIDVKVGSEIKTGDRLGLSGATGRVEAAHLHWGAKVSNQNFNPVYLFDLNP